MVATENPQNEWRQGKNYSGELDEIANLGVTRSAIEKQRKDYVFS